MLMEAAAETPEADDPGDIMTAAEASAWLRVSIFTVRREAAAGRIPAQKVGRGWRFSRAALVAHMTEAGRSRRSR